MMEEITPQEKIQQLEHRVQILTQLAETSASLNSRLELEPLLASFMEVAVEITGSEAASVLLWDKNTQELFFAASTSDTAGQLLGKPVPMDSIAGTIVRENRIIQVNDAKSDPRHYSKVDEDIKFQTRSLLGVPMSYDGRLIGVVQALNKRQLPWTPDDRHYLRILASQAAVAIEKAQLVTELRRANNELSEVDELKNRFIAIASHELRTPLGVIMGYASFLEQDENPETQELAGAVLSSALKLRQIIEDMVNLRYLKQSQKDLLLTPVTVRELIADVERDSHTLLDINKRKLEILPPENTLTLNVDQPRMLMVITNLLNNAINFSKPESTIVLNVEERSNEVWIRVQDNGIGLEADKLEKIFDDFYQVEDHMTRHVGGLGIGLSIAKAIVEAHNGRIWAESPGLGQGSTFTIALPVYVVT